jgi:hypothetical protein
MTKLIPEDVRAQIDIPESDWTSSATEIVWPCERRHVAKFLTSSMRYKSSGAFKFELSRGGFQSAVFVFALNLWSQIALIPMPIFLLFIVLGAANDHNPGLRRTEFEIGWGAGVVMLFFLVVCVQRLLYWRRVYGKQFSRKAEAYISGQASGS